MFTPVRPLLAVCLFGLMTGLPTSSVPLCSQARADAPWDAAPGEWPYWRGPQQNGHVTETNLPTEWDPDGKNLLWKRDDLGSRSTPIILNDKLYLILRDKPGTIEEGEKVVCLNANTGETIWENRFNVYLSDVPDTRVGWSSVTGDPDTGNIFALGVAGLFQCIDGETGETIWQHSLSEEYGVLTTYGGRTNFPIVHDDQVIISGIIIGWGEMAKPAHRFISFDKRNGQAVWFESTRLLPEDTTYSAPTIAIIDGQAQLVFGAGDGAIWSFQPRTGKSLWHYEVSGRGINTPPLVADGVVYAGHSEENYDSTKMGALFALDPTKTGDILETGEKWRVKEWFVGKSAPLMIDGKLYAIEDKANLLIVDPKTGERIGRQKLGTMQRSSPIYADGKIYNATANGRWYTMKPTEDGVEILYRMRLDGEVHGSFAVSKGKLFVPTTNALYCVGFKDWDGEIGEAPAAPTEAPVEDDQKPAHLQLVPCESLLKPGQKQQFQVRLYNGKGQFLGLLPPEEVEFEVTGSSSAPEMTIGEGGKLSLPDGDTHYAYMVTAKAKGLTGDARGRVVPELPWSFGFDDGQVPVTWVGMRYRHVPLDFDYYSELKADDELAADIYVYLSSSFSNSGRDSIKYDRADSRQTLTGFLRFLDMLRDVVTVEQAKEQLDPALEKLKSTGFLKDWSWSEAESGMIFTASRGDRAPDGNGVMTKIRTIPKGTRSQGWMGHPEFSDYTMQADVYAADRVRLPDMGITAQRYTLDLMGASQQIQVRTWPPQLRMAKSMPFEWQAETWYTLKLQASNEGDQTVLRAKVWKRGEDEPADWMLEATDPSPNRNGSPGYFGNAKDAEIFYDNVSVTPNDG